jgi:hypothetical protein
MQVITETGLEDLQQRFWVPERALNAAD